MVKRQDGLPLTSRSVWYPPSDFGLMVKPALTDSILGKCVGGLLDRKCTIMKGAISFLMATNYNPPKKHPFCLFFDLFFIPLYLT